MIPESGAGARARASRPRGARNVAGPGDVTSAIASGKEIDYYPAMAPPLRPPVAAAARRLSLAALALAACSDSPSTPDGGPDGPNPCPSPERFYTGELLSWDSTPGMFRGVFDAAYTVEGQAARTDRTSPNGRFELCLADAAVTQLTVEPTTASMFQGGIAVAEAEVMRAVAMVSMRTFTPTQEAAFSPRLAAGKAHVFVDVSGKQRTVTVAGASPTFAWDGASWAPATAGATGAALFFANLEPSAAPVAAAMSGTHLGGKQVPLVADRVTWVTMVGR